MLSIILKTIKLATKIPSSKQIFLLKMWKLLSKVECNLEVINNIV